MRIAWQNLIESATLTTDSQIASLPAENVQSDPLVKKWHTNAASSAYLKADLATAQACNVLALLKTNLTTAATIRVRASNSDADLGDLLDTGIGSPPANDDAGVKDAYGAVYVIFDSTVTARYWRIDLEDTSQTNLQIGRAFLGPAWTPSRGVQFGYQLAWIDASTGLRSDGGQDIFSEREIRRQMRFTLAHTTKAEMYGNAFELARAQGVVRNILVIVEETGDYIVENAIYGRVSAPIPLVLEQHNAYRMRYDVEERL